MLDIYICEDNETWRKTLTEYVMSYSAINEIDADVVLSTHNPAEILEHWNAANPTLFLLDIDLKADLNGIELAGKIRENDNSGQKAFIVFITTHSEMTLLTFQYKVEALDFIIKDDPDSIKRKVGECIDTAIERIYSHKNLKILKVPVDDKIIMVDMDEIVFIETTHVRHKLRLHTETRVFEFNGELKQAEEKLDDRFIRCHKSYIINKNKIKELNKKQNTITMTNGTTCHISRSGMKLLR